MVKRREPATHPMKANRERSAAQTQESIRFVATQCRLVQASPRAYDLARSKSDAAAAARREDFHHARRPLAGGGRSACVRRVRSHSCRRDRATFIGTGGPCDRDIAFRLADAEL